MKAPWKQGESCSEAGRNHVTFEFAAGGTNTCSVRRSSLQQAGKQFAAGAAHQVYYDYIITKDSLSQWIKFRDFGYKDTHFPPQFGREKGIFATSIY